MFSLADASESCLVSALSGDDGRHERNVAVVAVVAVFTTLIVLVAKRENDGAIPKVQSL